MKYIKIIFLVLIISTIGCTDKFEDFNTDQKNPAEVAGEGLFTNAQKELADQVNETNVNQNNWKLWSQFWTETTYTDEANYNIVTRNVPQQVYRYFYRETLRDLSEASTIIAAEKNTTNNVNFEAEKKNKLAIIELLNIYSYQRLVDIFGMAIYSEALNIENVYPKYDAGIDVYNDLITRLDVAITNLDATQASFGSADLYYGGNVASWIKFANTLKVKLGITIADSHDATARTLIEAGASGAFMSLADDCEMPYSSASPNQNPLYENLVQSGRDDFVPANTLVDYLNGVKDPRLHTYFENKMKVRFPVDKGAKQNDTIIIDVPILFFYADGTDSLMSPDSVLDVVLDKKVFGIVVEQADTIKKPAYYSGGTYGYSSPYTQYSHVNSTIVKPDFNGLIMGYTELQFYLAEAAARGYNVGGTAESFYNAGITASFDFWGVADVASYLAKPEVAYSTATGSWEQKIGTQSWIANYTKGFVAYTTWRRLDYPQFNIAENITTYSEIPTRFTFPINEQTLNNASYTQAAIDVGGDLLTTKIFWDTKVSPFVK